MSELFEGCAVQLRATAFRRLLLELLEVDKWRELAKDREAFDQRLNKIMQAIRSLMHSEYGLSRPRHAPVLHESRDKQIYEERRIRPVKPS